MTFALAFRLVVAIAVLVLAICLAFPSSRRLMRDGERWARDWGVVVPGDDAAAFDRRARLDSRLAALVFAPLALLILFWQGSLDDFAIVFVLWILLFTPVMLGRVVRGVPALSTAGAERMARLRATTLRDYLSPFAFVLPFSCAVASLGLLVAGSFQGTPSLVLGAAVVGQAAVTAAAILVMAWVVRTSLPAGDELHLRLLDADRASSMLRVVGLAMAPAMVLVPQLVEVGVSASAAEVLPTGLLPAGFLLCLYWLRKDARTRLRRLWDASGAARSPGPVVTS